MAEKHFLDYDGLKIFFAKIKSIFVSSGGTTDYGTTSISNGTLTLTSAVGKKIENGGEIFNNYSGNSATKVYSHAEGSATAATGSVSHAEGYSTKAIGDVSHAEGSGTEAQSAYSHAEGYESKTQEQYAHAEGYKTISSGDSSHSEGQNTTASAGASHAEGSRTVASDTCAHAEGSDSIASGMNSHAEGSTSHAEGAASHAEGGSTYAVGAYSHAEGYGTLANSTCSHAEGKSTSATEEDSHAEGNSTTASGLQSHAEGLSTKATSTACHAEGRETEASGLESHAEGYGSIAGGPYSHAEGQDSSTASNAYSCHAEGLGTIAGSSYQHVSGKYNLSDIDEQYVVIVGNGTNKTTRSNALTVDWAGNVKCGKTDTSGNWTYGTVNGVDISKYASTSWTSLTLDSNNVESGQIQAKIIGDMVFVRGRNIVLKSDMKVAPQAPFVLATTTDFNFNTYKTCGLVCFGAGGLYPAQLTAERYTVGEESTDMIDGFAIGNLIPAGTTCYDFMLVGAK